MSPFLFACLWDYLHAFLAMTIFRPASSSTSPSLWPLQHLASKMFRIYWALQSYSTYRGNSVLPVILIVRQHGLYPRHFVRQILAWVNLHKDKEMNEWVYMGRETASDFIYMYIYSCLQTSSVSNTHHYEMCIDDIDNTHALQIENTSESDPRSYSIKAVMKNNPRNNSIPSAYIWYISHPSPSPPPPLPIIGKRPQASTSRPKWIVRSEYFKSTSCTMHANRLYSKDLHWYTIKIILLNR